MYCGYSCLYCFQTLFIARAWQYGVLNRELNSLQSNTTVKYTQHEWSWAQGWCVHYLVSARLALCCGRAFLSLVPAPRFALHLSYGKQLLRPVTDECFGGCLSRTFLYTLHEGDPALHAPLLIWALWVQHSARTVRVAEAVPMGWPHFAKLNVMGHRKYHYIAWFFLV